MAASFEYGFTLPNGTRIVHGEGAQRKSALPPETNISGTMSVYNSGHTMDPSTPRFCGPQGYFHFDTDTRMPRHIHLSSTASDYNQRFIVEKIFVPYGVALVELCGQVYVIPPRTLVLIAPGVPHTWTACPAGLNVSEALSLEEEDEEVISSGEFMAVYEYEDATGFFPTAQMGRLNDPRDYVKCEDLHSIRIPQYNVEDVLKDALFVWGTSVRKAAGNEP